jgi:hypothetical protein
MKEGDVMAPKRAETLRNIVATIDRVFRAHSREYNREREKDEQDAKDKAKKP